MKLRTINNYILTAIILIASINTANAFDLSGNKLTVGGTSDLLFTSDSTGYASASGTFSALVATIISFEPQSDGTIFLGSQHNFKTNDNGYINTEDKSILYPVSDKPGVYMITTTFTILESAGSLSGYTNQSFTGTGIINFNNNTANVRYEGTLNRINSLYKKQRMSVFKYFYNN
ncbi:MAG: hypothetical protein QM500_20755 [Methylococcales bacterium]